MENLMVIEFTESLIGNGVGAKLNALRYTTPRLLPRTKLYNTLKTVLLIIPIKLLS